MNKKWLFALILVFAVVILFLFLKWLHSPEPYLGESDGSLTDTAEVFSYDVEKRLRLEVYSNNIYIQMLNTVMTGMKVNYEKEYGCPMPGLIESAVSRITDGLHTDAGNPITYLNFAFTAFSQYDPSLFAYAEAGGSGTAPNITDFEDVPEGAIYFSEEDEYKAEELINGQQPSASTGSQISQIAEDSIGMPGEIALDSKSPQILIYHSHSTESYMPNTASNYHTQNDKYNVVAVGSRLAKELEDKYKYKVLHDKTKHDKESYAYSYANSLQTIKNSINKYKSIKVIMDLHRDAFDAEKATFAEKTAKKAEYTTSINGKRAARIMLVIAKENPNYAELEKFAVYIKKKMDKLYPGLFLKIDVKSRGKYNLYFSNHSMLVEIGCMLNTIEEAQYSAELFARVIGEVINDLKE